MMQNNDLPELDPALDNIVKLERRKNSLVMTYSFRPFLFWIFLSAATLFVLFLYFAGIDNSIIGAAIVSCLVFISFMQIRVFDKCQIEFFPREIICKRGFLFPKVTTLRRYTNHDLEIKAEIESRRNSHINNHGGTVENYSTYISDWYGSFVVYCKSRGISLQLVNIMKECEKLTRVND